MNTYEMSQEMLARQQRLIDAAEMPESFETAKDLPEMMKVIQSQRTGSPSSTPLPENLGFSSTELETPSPSST